QQQLREIHYACASARRLVRGVELDELMARWIVAVLELMRPESLVLVRVDEPLHFAGNPAGLVEVLRLDQLLYDPLLILRIQDLKPLGQLRVAPVDTQKTVCDPVKGADP